MDEVTRWLPYRNNGINNVRPDSVIRKWSARWRNLREFGSFLSPERIFSWLTEEVFPEFFKIWDLHLQKYFNYFLIILKNYVINLF